MTKPLKPRSDLEVASRQAARAFKEIVEEAAAARGEPVDQVLVQAPSLDGMEVVGDLGAALTRAPSVEYHSPETRRSLKFIVKDLEGLREGMRRLFPDVLVKRTLES